MTTIALRVQGMDCAEEVAAIRAAVERLPGVQDLSFHILTGKVTVQFAESPVSPQDLIRAIAQIGLTADLWESEATEVTTWQRWGRTVLTTVSGSFLILGFASHVAAVGWFSAVAGEAPANTLIAKSCYLVATIAGTWFILPKAWSSLRRLRPDMNLLMTIAVAGALAIGEWFEAATVSFLFAISLALESWSVSRARRAIAALVALSPDQALVLNPDGSESFVATEKVPIGATIVVRPGSKFPLDGRIRAGSTSVNQAPITGESMPVPKSVGSEVFAGTINQEGTVECTTTKAAGDTTLARIVRLVDTAQSQRSPSEQWVERFARYYTPTVLLLALLVMLLPPLLFGQQWSTWIYEGLVLLVIACPCALVISTPVSVVAALTASARRGVLIKGGAFLEAIGKVQAVAMDKTGTLTTGHPELQLVVPLSGHDEAEVLTLAAAVERRSEHPLARAIVKAADERKLRSIAAENFQAIPGKGATARVDGTGIWIGSHRLLEARGQETPEMHDRLSAMETSGSSVVVIGKEAHVCGLIAVGDTIRPESRNAVAEMKSAGVQQLVMLTGDNRGTAEAIGREVGIDQVFAELLPQDKLQAIEDLMKRFGDVAMIGDGVNDAPAMARATVGIAMGAVGTDVALETADIALMGDDLTAVAWVIKHARRALSIIRWNIAAALLTKAVFMILALSGHASLWAAIAADTGASLVVIANGLRLLRDPSRQSAVASPPLGLRVAEWT